MVVAVPLAVAIAVIALGGAVIAPAFILAAALLLVAPSGAAAQDRPFKCTACEGVVEWTESFLQSNWTVNAIVHQFETLCAVAPVSFRAPCIQFVDAYVPGIVTKIAKYEAPAVICQQVKLCQAAQAAFKPLAIAMPFKTVPRPAAIGDGKYCQVCEMLAGVVEQFVLAETTVAETKKLLAGVCAKTPIEQVCVDFVNTYVPQFFNYLKTTETPENLCKHFTLCEGTAHS